MRLHKFGNTLQKKGSQFVKTICLYCKNWFHNDIKNKKLNQWPLDSFMKFVFRSTGKNSTFSKPQETYCPSGRFAFLSPGIIGPHLYSLYGLRKAEEAFLMFQLQGRKPFHLCNSIRKSRRWKWLSWRLTLQGGGNEGNGCSVFPCMLIIIF